jgi:hypothetical protein
MTDIEAPDRAISAFRARLVVGQGAQATLQGQTPCGKPAGADLVVIKTHLLSWFSLIRMTNRTRHAGAGSGGGREFGDKPRDLGEQHARHGDLGHLEAPWAQRSSFGPLVRAASRDRGLLFVTGL